MYTDDQRKAQLVGTILGLLIALVVTIPIWTNWLSGADSRPDTPTRALPSDICMIEGKPLMPELDYVDHGARPVQGLVLKYINANGDLVMMGNEEIIGMYEGNFCQEAE